MISTLVNGALSGAPEQRTSKTGRPFALATIRLKEGDSPQFVRIVAFSNTVQSELTRLKDGDALSVQGRLQPPAAIGLRPAGMSHETVSLCRAKASPTGLPAPASGRAYSQPTPDRR